jgi:hypothetical protein
MSLKQSHPGGIDSPESLRNASTIAASISREDGPHATHVGERAQPAPGVGGPGLGTQPTNRVPNSYKEDKERGFQVLRFGVDTLELTYPGVLKPAADREFKRLKELAQSQNPSDVALAQVQSSGSLFEVRERGSRRFAYAISNPNYWIQLSRGRSKDFPAAAVRMSSGALAAQSPRVLDIDVARVLAEWVDELGSPGVSRIDLFVDFVAPVNMEGWHRSAWVTRAKGISQHAVGNTFSGWSIGLGSDISCRLYDKMLEIVTHSPDKAYLFELWKAQGWDMSSAVWRLEFQIRRAVLTQFQKKHLFEVLDHLNGLWSYASTEWLQLKMPDESDSNRARWAVHPLWAFLSLLDWEGNGGPLARKFRTDRIPDMKRAMQVGVSYLASFMASQGLDDVDEGFRAYVDALRKHLDEVSFKTEIPPEELVLEKVELKRRQFNSGFNQDKVNPERQARTNPEVSLDPVYEGDPAGYTRSSNGG